MMKNSTYKLADIGQQDLGNFFRVSLSHLLIIRIDICSYQCVKVIILISNRACVLTMSDICIVNVKKPRQPS